MYSVDVFDYRQLASFSDHTPSDCFTLGDNVYRIWSTITVLHKFRSYRHYLHVLLRIRHILAMRYGIVECEQKNPGIKHHALE